MRVLVVEDYEPLLAATTQALREEGHAVDQARDRQEGTYLIAGTDYDVAIIDIMLPDGSGLDILRELREIESRTRVLVLTARDAVEDRVAGLDAGADDYLVKPFAMEELLARVRSLVRRRYEQEGSCLSIGHVEIDTNRHVVRCAGNAVELTAREYALLEYLALRSGQVVSRTDIWNHVYDDQSSATSNVVDVYIGYLRKKLEPGDLPRLIHTRRGEGYCLEVVRE